jgi:DNA invertase Pin-like site-specific DNA recombinase
MARAAMYLRASTDLQVYSTTNQADALISYAEASGHRVVRTYEDDGRSGMTLNGRPGLRQLLNDILAGDPGFEVVLVYDISRWGRFQDADEGAHYEFLCRRAGVRVVYCCEPFVDGDVALNTIMKAVKRTMAAEYSRELSEKVARGQRRIASLGFALGVPPFGLRRLMVDPDRRPKQILQAGERKALQDHHIIWIPGPEAETRVVRRIFKRFVNDDILPSHIARELNEQNIQNRLRRPWTRTNVVSLLQNEAYIGTLVFGRTDTRIGRKTGIKTCPTTWVRVPNAFEAIISGALFRRAQRRFTRGVLVRSDEPFLRSMQARDKSMDCMSSGPIVSGRIDRAKLAAEVNHALDAGEISTRELCVAAGVSHHSVERLRSGQRIGPPSAFAIASGLMVLSRQRRGRQEKDQRALYQLRNLVHWAGSQRRAAHLLGVSRPLVSRMLDGKRSLSVAVFNRLQSSMALIPMTALNS